MRLSLSRSFNPDKLAWLNDLNERVRTNQQVWSHYHKEILPVEDDFVDDSRRKFSEAIDRLRKDGWFWLGRTKSIAQINWLLQQDSWCIVDIPFEDTTEALTKDELTSIKYRLMFGDYISARQLSEWIEQYTWDVFPVASKSIGLQVEDWCDSYCSGIYFFHTIERDGIKSDRIVFLDTNDALRFKLSGFGVDN